jgi:hypothetical protein
MELSVVLPCLNEAERSRRASVALITAGALGFALALPSQAVLASFLVSLLGMGRR